MRAVLLDVDGTLVDSNYLHIEAWTHAFSDLELPVDAWRLHRCIGMDADKLLTRLLDETRDQKLLGFHSDRESLGERAKELHARYYDELAPRLRVFAGGRQFVAALNERGVSVVLATSAPEAELKHLRAVLDIEAELSEVTSDDDVATAKPAPDIVAVAMDKAASEPADTIMIGDSVWDVEAAANAGVRCIGVLSGGTSRAELQDAGAIAIYTDVGELLEQLEQSPLARLMSA